MACTIQLQAPCLFNMESSHSVDIGFGLVFYGAAMHVPM